MSYRYILLGAIISLSVAGCTCRDEVKAYVKDSETRQPVMGMTVETVAALKGNYKKGNIDYTDSAGYFLSRYEINNIAKCPVTKLFISGPGYQDKIVIAPKTGDTIYVDKIK